MKVLLSILAVGFVCLSLRAEVTMRDVTYPAGSVTAKGVLAIPAGASAEDQRPGVLVVHEWWGLNDYARERAKMLAELGYVALAVDMYGDGKVATHPDDAKAFAAAAASDQAEARARFVAAMKYLETQPQVNVEQIGAIGYCFGGGVVLQMAADGVAGLDAVVSFHGSLGATVPEGVEPTAKMLVLTGGADSFVPPDAIKEFEGRMKAAGADVTVTAYPGAKHGFTNPGADASAEEFGLDLAYDPSADQKSWAAMQEFLSAAFGISGQSGANP